MADKAITELVAAEDITASDLFVLQQNDTAKKLPGQVLLNWLTKAADGHGGIKSIEKLRTNVLADTYRITLADTTTFDFVVNNGRGISSIVKAGTSGLVDTYRISYNDGTTSTFSVSNGAKGDKGDNAYIWVKYASQEPTAQSHSFGDIPDAWIGVYFGTASTAPTDWQQYRWYQWKGDKGDTGAPATLTSAEITYQMGDSGTVIPSGSWTTSIPAVTPGRYLWIRQVIRFNTGSPITIYSISRFGIDGTGAVSSVAGVAPDENGNVSLNAASVKALALSGGIMEGSINMNGQPLSGLNAPTEDSQAANKEYVDMKLYPVGAIYMSADSTSPASLFGGTWEQLKDRFLLGAGDTYAAGDTGGEAVHTLTVDEMPAHRHQVRRRSGTGKGENALETVTDVQRTEDSVYGALPNGGDKPHNNMPPYQVVYMWKRVA